MGGDFGVGELGPTRQACHNDTARRHWVVLANLKGTFDRGGGGELLEKGPPTPCPNDVLLCQRRGRSRSLA